MITPLSQKDRGTVNEYINRFGEEGYIDLINVGRSGYVSKIEELRPDAIKKLIILMEVKIRSSRRSTIRNPRVLRDNHRRVMSSDNTKMSRVWVTNDGHEVAIHDMENSHLHNTILFLTRKIDEGLYRVGKNDGLPNMLKEMEQERVNRGMPVPLIPFKSLSYTKGTHL